MKKIFLIIALVVNYSIYAQNPNPFPRGLTTPFVELDTITSAQRDSYNIRDSKRRLIYNITTDQLEYYNGSSWQNLGGGGSSYTPISEFNVSHKINSIFGQTAGNGNVVFEYAGSDITNILFNAEYSEYLYAFEALEGTHDFFIQVFNKTKLKGLLGEVTGFNENIVSSVEYYSASINLGDMDEADIDVGDDVEVFITVTEKVTDAQVETAYNNQVDVATQAEAEAGTGTSVKRWTPQRIKQAIETLNSNASTGLEELDEGNGIGYRFVSANPAWYGTLGENAVDLSIRTESSGINDFGATGLNTVAIGHSATAEGIGSIAIGGGADASGGAVSIGMSSYAPSVYNTAVGNLASTSNGGSSAFGYDSYAAGVYSAALGSKSNAYAPYSTAIGHESISRSAFEISLGAFGTDSGGSGSWVATDRLFGIGAGQNTSSRADAMIILKNGLATLPLVTNTLIDAGSGKSIITKEYADANYAGGGGTDDQTASEVLMTGYVKNLTAGVALSAADNVNQGLGKLEKTTEDLRTDINLIALGFAADGDKGDITVSGAGSIWSIDNNAVTNAKVATGINADKIANGSVSNTEYQYLDGVTSNVQTQIDGKVGDITKAADSDGYFESGTGATTFVQIGETGYARINADANEKEVTLTADELWLSNVQGSQGLGYFDLSTLVTGTDWAWELPSKHGTVALTSDIPDNTISDSSQATTYTFALGDEDKIITYNSASDGDFNIPTNASVAFPIGTIITCESLGTGNLTIDFSAVTGTGATTTTSDKLISIKKTATDTWRVIDAPFDAASADEVTTATATGTTIDMSGKTQDNFGAASSAATFTMVNISVGGYAEVLINKSGSAPTVTGATQFPNTATFQASTNMVLCVKDFNGTRKFWFVEF